MGINDEEATACRGNGNSSSDAAASFQRIADLQALLDSTNLKQVHRRGMHGAGAGNGMVRVGTLRGDGWINVSFPSFGEETKQRGTPNQTPPFTTFYNCPVGLGAVNKTIGGPRQIQMALHLTF